MFRDKGIVTTTAAALCAVAGAAAFTLYSRSPHTSYENDDRKANDNNYLAVEPFDNDTFFTQNNRRQSINPFNRTIYIPYEDTLSFDRMVFQIAHKFHINPHYIQIYASYSRSRNRHPQTSSHHMSDGSSDHEWTRVGSLWYDDYLRKRIVLRRKAPTRSDEETTLSLLSRSLTSAWDVANSLLAESSDRQNESSRMISRRPRVWGREKHGDEIVSYQPHDDRRVKFSFSIEPPLLPTIFEDPQMYEWNLNALLDAW